MPNWKKIQITDEAIESAHRMNSSISKDDAFDLLLDLIENGEHAKFKGIDQDGVECYRLENEYIYINNNLLVNYSRRNRYSLKTVTEIHAAEDGRCENCGRAMDKRAVQIRRIDPFIFNELSNYVLLCPDCMINQPDVLEDAKFAEATIERYQEIQSVSLDQAIRELDIIKNNLVLLLVKGGRRKYWLPSLGVFTYHQGELSIESFYKNVNPPLEKKLQKRSRRWSEITTT
ncbi:HNH endonuclease signature motif containing protein [Paenibacillus sp. FSL F4-0125]|uniref:HNH endonuclease signature motif containing protein n=1 Tax=Paenibacillus sp. FSL F4-0125 TaxID=2954730 RepID=UPI0030F584C9